VQGVFALLTALGLIHKAEKAGIIGVGRIGK
jgi:hypothetical protein